MNCEGCKYLMNGCCLFWGRIIDPKEEKECTAKEVL